MTIKLYWKNAYETQFIAKVLLVKEKGIILDKTLFYPESGNQISDHGFLLINDLKIEVKKVVKEGDDILHLISSEFIDKINIGDQAKGEIDWEYRYGIMKAHTSQHIFSAVTKKMYNIDTERANLNFEEVFLKISQKIDYEQLKKILLEVNKICTKQDLKLNAKIIPFQEAVKVTEKIRSVIPDESNIRLIEIQDLDLVCCGGTHVKNTTEIGSLLIYDFKKENEIRYVVGNKALELGSSINLDVIAIANYINCSILKLKKLLKKRLEYIENLQEQNKNLSIKLFKSILKSPLKVINKISVFYIDFNIDIKILNKFLDEFPSNSLIIVKFEDNKIRILSPNKIIDSNKLLQKLITNFGGKGGGNPKSAQGFLKKMPENIIFEIESLIKND